MLLKVRVTFQREGAGNSCVSQEEGLYLASSLSSCTFSWVAHRHVNVSKTNPTAYAPTPRAPHLNPSFSKLLFLLNYILIKSITRKLAGIPNSWFPFSLTVNQSPSPAESFSLIVDHWSLITGAHHSPHSPATARPKPSSHFSPKYVTTPNSPK